MIEIAPRPGETWIRTEDIEKRIAAEGEKIALVMIGGVNYYTGQAFDFPRITNAGHAKGCIVGFDMAHAAGNVPLKLHDWNVDFAVWCSYKYLNSGPGSIAGCFVHERHARDPKLPRFAGWWGHDKENRFRMHPDFSLFREPRAGNSATRPFCRRRRCEPPWIFSIKRKWDVCAQKVSR